jgi:hypothetical protein
MNNENNKFYNSTKLYTNTNFPFAHSLMVTLVNFPPTITGKPKVVNTRCHKYYPTKPINP